jgi:hypothetical protein
MQGYCSGAQCLQCKVSEYVQEAADREADALKKQLAILEAAALDADERSAQAQRQARADARAAIAKGRAASESAAVCHPQTVLHPSGKRAVQLNWGTTCS